MTGVVRLDPRHLPDLLDWAEGLPGLFGSSPLGPRALRLEEYVDEDKYVIRVELPGVDPEKDVKLHAESGVLTVRAERHEENRERLHSEFRYGSLTRRIALPEGADEAKATARYGAGILEIAVPITSSRKDVQTIPIERAD